MKADEAAQPGTPLPSGGQAIGCDAVGSRPPFVPDYTLLCRIGIGAYGEVWLARGTLGAYRAVKIVSRRSFEHDQPFEREFKGIQRFEPISLTHESQVKILHVGRNENAGYFYYVMELADCAAEEKEKRGGGEKGKISFAPFPLCSSAPAPPQSSATYVPRTLKHEVQSRGRLPVDECVQIGLALTTALAHLHDHGLIHRDVKPSNIIFVNGVPKLADIGLVTDIEATRSFVGTEGFIPPEGPGTVSADVYSLGKVLYEISMGRSRLDFPALPTNWDEIPEADQARLLEFNEVLVKASESDAARRYGSARQMHADLELLQRGKSVKQKRSAEQRWATTKKLAIAAAVMALLITTLLFWKGSKPEHTPNPEAVRLYELGRWHYNQLTETDHAKAFTYLTQAVEMDSQFVRPYSELTALYVWALLPELSNEAKLQKTRAIADKLMAMDPKLAEGHTALSWCHFLERDWRGAEDEIVHAIKLNPNLAFAHDIYCFYLSMQGRTDEARRIGQRAQALKPPEAARVTAVVAAWPFMAERRFDRAIAQLQRCMELDRNFSIGHHYLGSCYEAQSNYVAAIEEFKSFELLSGKDPARVTAQYAALRQAYDAQGEQGYFRQWIEKILADEADEQQTFGQDSAGYYALLGQKEKALEALERDFDTFGIWQTLKFDVHYDTLHDEPRFKALLKKARLEK
jgi:serine/threonine protein kinase/Tfp pilus assembly protein PilF